MLPQWITFSDEEERAIDQIWAEIGREVAEQRKSERERLRVGRHNELRAQRRRRREQEQEHG